MSIKTNICMAEDLYLTTRVHNHKAVQLQQMHTYTLVVKHTCHIHAYHFLGTQFLIIQRVVCYVHTCSCSRRIISVLPTQQFAWSQQRYIRRKAWTQTTRQKQVSSIFSIPLPLTITPANVQCSLLLSQTTGAQITLQMWCTSITLSTAHCPMAEAIFN